ncbi:MAG: restriction endonuclease subunit S [Bacteroidales bacterium]|jgi:type I restriction enzyme S subunit
MPENNNIPKHWQVKKLGEVCLTTSGGTPSRSQSKYYKGNIPWVKSGELNKGLILETEEKITEEALGNSSAKIFPKGTLLIALYGATIGKLAFLGIDAATNQAVCGILKNENVDSNYLFHFLFYKKPSLIKQSIGGAQPNINQGILKNLEIPLPPLTEQLAIVSKIEELLSDLENGKQQLQTAQQQLKIYRQSLLKAAFEGKLTSAGRTLRKAQGTAAPVVEHVETTGTKDGELPEGWKWVKLGDVCAKIGDIDHKMPKQHSSGYPYVSTKDFTDDLKISFNNTKYISEEDYLNLSRKIKPEKGDIIFPRYGTIGKNILVDFDKEFLVSYSCAVIKPNHSLVLSKYVYLYSLSSTVTEEIRKYTVETTQANVGIASIKSFVFPLPPITEQQRIVDELESKFTICDKIEETINQSLQQAETLRQSILKKAFEGRLIMNPEGMK